MNSAVVVTCTGRQVPGLYYCRFFSVGMYERRNVQNKVNTRDELIACIMNSSALKEERQDDLRRIHLLLSTERKEHCIINYLNPNLHGSRTKSILFCSLELYLSVENGLRAL